MAPGDSTASANMSLRRGARLSAAAMIPLWIAAALAMLSRGFRTFALADMGHRSPSAWLAIVLLLGLSAWLIYEALKSGRIRLTPDQIGHGRDDNSVRWADITLAEYRTGWLRLRDRGGRNVAFNLMFASSTHDVLEAIQDHLPPGVRLRVY